MTDRKPLVIASGHQEVLQVGDALVDPAGNPYLTSASGVGPGGTSGQVQFNHAGVFGGFTVAGDATLDTATGDLTLASTAVTPGTYGDATHVGQFTVDAKGRLTFAQSVAISGGGGGSWFPLTNGVEPPAMISNGAGVPIAVAYAP